MFQQFTQNPYQQTNIQQILSLYQYGLLANELENKNSFARNILPSQPSFSTFTQPCAQNLSSQGNWGNSLAMLLQMDPKLKLESLPAIGNSLSLIMPKNESSPTSNENLSTQALFQSRQSDLLSQKRAHKSVNSKDPSESSIEDKEKQKYFKCPLKNCDKVFPKECNLKDHVRTHTGERPFVCNFPLCSRSFSQQGNLKKHEKVHLGEKKFVCEFPGCGKNFSASYNLKIHSRCHTGEKPYKCTFDDCDRSFYDKGNLKYHERTAHSLEIKNFPFSCEHICCNLKFRTKRDKLLHHNNLEVSCKDEKDSLVLLIQSYVEGINFLIKHYSLDQSLVEKNEDFVKLNIEFDQANNKLLDTEFFRQVLGEKLGIKVYNRE